MFERSKYLIPKSFAFCDMKKSRRRASECTSDFVKCELGERHSSSGSPPSHTQRPAGMQRKARTEWLKLTPFPSFCRIGGLGESRSPAAAQRKACCERALTLKHLIVLPYSNPRSRIRGVPVQGVRAFNDNTRGVSFLEATCTRGPQLPRFVLTMKVTGHTLNSVIKVSTCKISEYFKTGAVVIGKIFVVDNEIIFAYSVNFIDDEDYSIACDLLANELPCLLFEQENVSFIVTISFIIK